MNKINKKMSTSKKELPGTALFIALILGVVLLIGLQTSRNETMLANQPKTKPDVAAQAEDTRLVEVKQTAETTNH